MAQQSWTLEQLRHQLSVWEEQLHQEGYAQSSVWTYIRGAKSFLRWLGQDADASPAR